MSIYGIYNTNCIILVYQRFTAIHFLRNTNKLKRFVLCLSKFFCYIQRVTRCCEIKNHLKHLTYTCISLYRSNLFICRVIPVSAPSITKTFTHPRFKPRRYNPTTNRDFTFTLFNLRVENVKARSF